MDEKILMDLLNQLHQRIDRLEERVQATEIDLTEHEHDYADIDHDHDGEYATIDHDHYEEYAEIDHDHSDEYAEREHTHQIY